jgi:hypothetical protein
LGIARLDSFSRITTAAPAGMGIQQQAAIDFGRVGMAIQTVFNQGRSNARLEELSALIQTLSRTRWGIAG